MIRAKEKKIHSGARQKLAIRSLSVSVEGHAIVRDVNLTMFPGEIHLLMGPNGAGKSTLLNALAGHPRASITHGSVVLNGVSLAKLPAHIRAHKGMFLGFQQPVDVAGVTIASFLRSAKNALRGAEGKAPLSPTEFALSLKATLKALGMDERFGGRAVNAGLSGGEKKRGELLQMVVLKPRYALLDEFDSGLDVDALREVTRIISQEAKKGIGFLLVSHNPALRTLLPINAVHVMADGAIAARGGAELMKTIAQKGYVT